ncbi:MAG: MFS transporter [Planctomycetes bacterium]|nr:MFS transporter [Planctomycetota bacterium]
MSHISNIKKLLSSRQSPTALYTAAFFFSGGHGGIFTLAFPFVVTLLGGSDKDVGLCFGIGTITYLVSCLTVANHLDRFNPKRILQFSSAFIALTLVALFICTRIFLNGNLPIDPILLVIIVQILSCTALALFWPPMMGWISTGHEGGSLSKRMGIFNISWSLALVITTLLGGYILKTDTTLTVLASAIFLAIAFVFISVAPASQGSDKPGNTDAQPKSPQTIDPLNPAFCSMSRLGLIIGCLALGLFRTQLALFFTENLGFSKPQFGLLTAMLCFASFAGFYITARTKKWHHKLSPFIASQLVIAAAMLMILFCTSLFWLYIAAAFIGIGQSFVYASHQFYCVSGKVKRSGSMAVHEILIAIGYGGGSIAGGYLAEYLSRDWPYWFGFAAVMIALALQAAIFAYHKNVKI